MKNFVEELRWRGMLQDIIPGTEEQLLKEVTAGYVGIDPTADSLHIGHLCGIMMLRHLQRCGHKPIALIGGATGMIGDPSGKSAERNLLDEATLAHNVAHIKAQLEKFLDFNSNEPNAAELVNNYDWMKDYTFINFTRDIGKLITVNYMMAKDSVKKRFNGEFNCGMSFTEFTYQLLQGYDFAYLNKHKNCKLQMGGSDQWGNITTGMELIKKLNGGEAFALTCPLITKADGGKFGKTESGNVWLDKRYTSPYKFFQFWMNVSDDDAKRYIKIFTSLEKEEIDATNGYFYNLQKNNLIYVSNGLQNYTQANVILAGMLLNDLGDYPLPDFIGNAYWDMDYCDVDMDLVWFRNNYLRPTTVENLKNFAGDLFIKTVMVDRIIKWLKRNWPDMNDYIGTAFTDYKLVKIVEQSEEYLKSFVDWIIYDYKIISVDTEQYADSSIGIHIHYEIWPKFTTEKYVDEVIL